MQHRACEVRVCQARHLTSRNNVDFVDKRDKKSPITGICVLISHNGVHVPTEVCRDIDNPTWQRVAAFQLDIRGSLEEPAVAQAGPCESIGLSQVEHEAKDEEVMQSRNPFAKNFVPPESLPIQPPLPPTSSRSTTPSIPASVAVGPLRSSLVIHLHVLSDILISRELLGDVAVDLVPLLKTAHQRVSVLAIDRLGHVDEQIQLSGLPPDEGLAVDTWVTLRQKSGELRVQILIKPMSSASRVNRIDGSGGRPERIAGSQHPSTAVCALQRSSSSTNITSLEGPENDIQQRRSSGDDVVDRLQDDLSEVARRRGIRLDRTELPSRTAGQKELARRRSVGNSARMGVWPEFDTKTRDGMVKVSVPSSHCSLDDRLLEIQEQYDFSAARGYRQGKPDQDASNRDGRPITPKTTNVPEWPPSVGDAVRLRRDMHFAGLRNRRQLIAWADNLGSSSGLQQALRSPPPFGILRRKRVGLGKQMKVTAASTAFEQTGEELTDLVLRGIPDSLQQRKAMLKDAATEENGGMGGAFEGDDAELSFFGGVTTAVPRVEVVRVSGRLCCAEYQVQVKREALGDSWFVIRRYSDFRQLYDNLPRSVAAITPPLPPKSWRSLSFLSMTPEFLEDRRVALEVALRRLAINAVRADKTVQADVRAFLGFPPSTGTGVLAGVDPEVARHLARIPRQLELALPRRGPNPVSLLANLRVAMWMLLSGAAHKSSVTEDREQYPALKSVSDELEWCRYGGVAEDYRLAAAVFKTIDEDVNRTNVRDSDERERLRRVLKAFALKNPTTGYCQGMNSVALFLLRTSSAREDLCFWLLDALATTVMPGHWRGLSHISSATAGGVTLRILMAEQMPLLLEHLDSRGLPPEILACDFFLSLGCRALPPLSVLRVLDIVFWQGGDTLQYVALAVLHLAEEELLGVQGAAATSDCLSSCTRCMHDADSLIEYAEAAMERKLGKSGSGSSRESRGPSYSLPSSRNRQGQFESGIS